MSRWHPSAVVLVLFLVGSVGPVSATEGVGTTAVEGILSDDAGDPVADWRVVVRAAAGTDAFISPPSDHGGRYSVAVPSDGPHVIVALISPAGVRVALQEPVQVPDRRERFVRDLRVPLSLDVQPRAGADRFGGKDRLFLSFVEDPAVVGRQHWEVQLASALEQDGPDVDSARLVAAFAFESLPGVEIGARAGYGEIRGGCVRDDTGVLDLDLWGKIRLSGSATGDWDVAAGALMKLPTGDEDAGLGRDATQSELFFAASRNFPSAVVIAHVGVVTSEDGSSAGVALDGRLAASSGIGVLVPLAREASLVFEANYDGARFDETDADARLLAGINWQLDWNGRLRAALAAGLADASPDAELSVSYAVAF